MRLLNGSLGVRLGAMGIVMIAAGLLAAGGCAMSASRSDDPTTRALADPMNYSPNHDDDDITGGGLTNFNKDAFNRDMDHVLNP